MLICFENSQKYRQRILKVQCNQLYSNIKRHIHKNTTYSIGQNSRQKKVGSTQAQISDIERQLFERREFVDKLTISSTPPPYAISLNVSPNRLTAAEHSHGAGLAAACPCWHGPLRDPCCTSANCRSQRRSLCLKRLSFLDSVSRNLQ